MRITSFLAFATFSFKICQAVSLFELIELDPSFTPPTPGRFIDHPNEIYNSHPNSYETVVGSGCSSNPPKARNSNTPFDNFSENFDDLEDKVTNELSNSPFDLLDQEIASKEELLLASPIRPKNGDPEEASGGSTFSPENIACTSKGKLSLDSFPTKDDILIMGILENLTFKEYMTASGVLLRFMDLPGNSDDEVSLDSEETLILED